jgi:hypothetical protein
MKINTTILAAALGLASVSLASATQYIYISGAATSRGAVYNALAAGLGQDAAPTAIVYTGSSAASATYLEYVTSIGGTPTIIKTDWDGSEAGILDVTSSSQTELFLLDPGTGSVPASGAINPAPSTPNANYYAAETVNAGFAENSPLVSKNPTTTAHFIGPVAVIPFVFLKNAGAGLSGLGESDYSAFSNLTSDQFKVLAAGGDYLGLFTGNPADQNTFVYLAGRDDNAGARVNALAETGVGIKTSLSQVILANGVLTPAAYTDEGQASSGTLAKSLIDTTSPTVQTDSIQGTSGFNVVSYLGVPDAVTAEAAPINAIQLTYNGVAYSATAVENGTYAFWGYEFVGWKAGSATYIQNLVNTLANTSTGVGSSAYNDGSEIGLSNVHVSRADSLPTNPPVE